MAAVPADDGAALPKRSFLGRWWGRAYHDHPKWKKKLIVQTFFLWLLLGAHAGFLGWSRRYDPNLSSFWGSFGFDVLGVATDCSILRQQQLAWTLAVNILATLITYVSTDVLLALCSPTRRQLDASHANRQYLDVGVHSFRNIRSPHFGWWKRVLWVLLTILILPFHLIYNSVIIVSQPASESYQISVSESLFQVGDSAASSVSIVDTAATQAPLPVSAAATRSPGLVNVAAISTASQVTAVTADPNSSPTACVGPSSIVQASLSEATVQPNIASNCDSYAVAPCGMGCQDFLNELKVSISEFFEWNPSVTITKQGNCNSFFGGYAYCVGVNSSSSSRRSVVPLVRRTSDSPLDIDEADVAASTELLETWENFNNPKSTYWTSPFLSFDTPDPNAWPGLHEATEDLNNVLSLAYFNQSQSSWADLTVNSSDWIRLSLDDCRQQFSERYRPSTGTVVLVVSGVNTEESVIGLSYLSFDWTDLMVTCPTSFLQQSSASQLIIDENPPVLPLMFGTFQKKEFNNAVIKKANFNGTANVCPQSYPGLDSYQPGPQPMVEGCLLKSRQSVCRMGVNILFTVILLVALTMKAILMTLALFVVDEEPILTVGDAMAEYLERPDPNMAGTSLSWKENDGWTIIDESIAAYQHGRNRGHGEERDEKKWKDGHFSWLVTWPGRQWRKVWGYGDMGRKEVVPKSDIFNNLHTMRSADSVLWFWSYLCTLAVCMGIFYSIGSQNGWTVMPTGGADLWWMLWPTIICNLPQLFATIRGFTDTRILTSRSSLEDFASYATQRKGLRVSIPRKNTAQHPVYFFGGMNALVFATTTGLQTLYAWIISEFAQPQWINPLRPNDPPDYFSPAFLMKFGSDANRTLAGNICFVLLIILFPFLAVYLVNMTQSLVIRVRTLRVGELSTFIPQWLADVLLLRWITQWGRPEKTAHLLPLVPLQMPGPATNSLVIALACQPKASERRPGLSLQPLQWGVVQRPQQQQAHTASLAGHEKLDRIRSSSTLSSSTTPVVTNSAPIRSSISRKPVSVPVRSTSPASDDIEPAMSPTMMGAPHLSGDEAAFANAWSDLVGVPAGERSSEQQQQQQQMHERQQQHGYFADAIHAPPSVVEYPESNDPRQGGYYGVSPSHSPTIDTEKGFAAIDEHAVATHTTQPPHQPETETDEGWSPGHCSFSADPVDELEPGRSYTGIRRGEGSLGFGQQVALVVREFLRAALFVEFPDENGHSRHRSGPQYFGEVGDRASRVIAGLPHPHLHHHHDQHGYPPGHPQDPNQMQGYAQGYGPEQGYGLENGNGHEQWHAQSHGQGYGQGHPG